MANAVQSQANPAAVEVTPPGARPAIQVNAAYWRTVGVLCLITLFAGVGIFGLAIILLCLPMIQFVAAGIVAFRLRDQPGWKWHQLARLAGYSALGSVIGIVITCLLLLK